MMELTDYNVREIDRFLEDVSISNNEGSEDKEWFKVVFAGYINDEDDNQLILVAVIEAYYNGDLSYDGTYFPVNSEKSVLSEEDVDDGLGGGPNYQGGGTIQEMEEWLTRLGARDIYAYEGIDENDVR